MQLAKNWLSVSFGAGTVAVGIYVEGKGPLVQPVHRFRPPDDPPQWINVLDQFCRGKWLNYTVDLDRSLRRIEQLLAEVNESGGTNFRIESLCLPNSKKQIGLVGG